MVAWKALEIPLLGVEAHLPGIALTICAALFLIFIVTLVTFIRITKLGRRVEALQRRAQGLRSARERRFFHEIHSRHRPTLLLEAPKPTVSILLDLLNTEEAGEAPSPARVTDWSIVGIGGGAWRSVRLGGRATSGL